MEFADGGSVAALWNDTPQDPRRSAELVAIVAEAVHAAHERGVLHRDLKPSNILLSACPGLGMVPKVSDFGLWHRLGQGQRLTLTGQALGTPGYMSPEQARGRAQMTPVVDVYALGALLYEALTGGPPFRGATPIESLHLMLSHEPAPPSRLRPGIPRDLETICLRCLEPDPCRRYAGADAVADDLRRFLANRPIAARPISSGERVWKWAHRQPCTAALLAAVVLLLMVSLGLVTLLWQRAGRGELERTAHGEADARREAQEYATRLLVERAVGLCEAGKYGPGLLWFCRALETAPADAPELRDAIRSLISGWSSAVHPLRHAFAPADKVRFAAFARGGEWVVTAGKRSVRCWDAGTGAPVGPSIPPFGQIRAVAVSPDGHTVLVEADGAISQWDLRGGGSAGPSASHPAPLKAVAFGNTSRFVATASGTQVGLWDSTAWRRVHEFNHPRNVKHFAFGPRDTFLVTADDVGCVRVWDTATGLERVTLTGHTGPVHALAVSPDGRWVLTGSDDRTARLWDADAGREVRVFRAHTAPVRVVAFTADGQNVFTGGKDHHGFLWSVEGVNPRLRFLHEHSVVDVSFSPDGRFLATASNDDTARLWDLSTGEPVGEPLRHQDDVRTVAFHPLGSCLLTAGTDGSARVWDLRLPARRAVDLGKPVHTVDVTPDGRTILIATAKEELHLWEPSTGRFRRSMAIPNLYQVRASPSGSHFAVALWDGTARVLDLETAAPVGPTLTHRAPVLAATFSPDGKHLLTGCADPDATVRLWDWQSGSVVQTFSGHRRKVPAVAFRPDGLGIATGSWDRSAALWDLRTGRRSVEPIKHQDLVQSVCFSPDGTRLLTAGDDYTAILWDVPTGQQVGLAMRHPGKVQAAVFSPDGRLIVTGSKDRTARLWNVATGKPFAPPLPHDDEVHSVAFSPDGQWIYTGCWDGAVRCWQVPAIAADDTAALRRWLGVHTGLELDGNGSIVTATQADWRARSNLLRGRGE